MPYSSEEGKAWTKRGFERLPDVVHVTDIGPGSGTYSHLMHGERQIWTGVEIWALYVEQFMLESLYETVAIADARFYDWAVYGQQDVVILGDVVEHLHEHAGRKVIAKALAHSRFVILSLPVTDYPQGAEMGNPYEAHKTQWTDDQVRRDFGWAVAAQQIGSTVGVFVLASTDANRREAVRAFGLDN